MKTIAAVASVVAILGGVGGWAHATGVRVVPTWADHTHLVAEVEDTKRHMRQLEELGREQILLQLRRELRENPEDDRIQLEIERHEQRLKQLREQGDGQ